MEAAGEAGLAHMIAGLIEANLAANPGLERLLAGRRAVAEIAVIDSGVVVGLKFVPGAITVTGARVPAPDLRVSGDADIVLGLTTVPLRWGLPDVTTPAGREVAVAVLRRRLRVRGLPGGIGLLRTLNRLMSVG